MPVSEVERVLESPYGLAFTAAFAVVGNEADAWDVVHTAFAEVYRRRPFLLRLTASYVVKAARTSDALSRPATSATADLPDVRAGPARPVG